MKNKRIFIFTICFFFILISKVNAISSVTCDYNVIVDNNFECKVIIDNEPLMIKTDGNLKVSNLKGESYTKINDEQIVFYKTGSVIFGPAVSKYSNYLISVYYKDGKEKYLPDIKVNVTAKTTVTTTTKLKSSNCNLSAIFINDEALKEFSNSKKTYYLDVENDVKKITIDASPEDNSSNINISGPDTLEIGENLYTITVTSEDNTTNFYKVIVTRKDTNKSSSDTSLKNIKIKGYKFNFDSKAKTFYLKLNDGDTSLDISVITNDEKASYTISGNENLEDGSVIKIKVISQDLSEDLYRIIIQKEEEKKVNVIIIVVVLIIILTLILIFILKIRNKKKKPKKLKENKVKQKVIHHDNDEEDKTKFLNYDEISTLEKTKISDLDDLPNNVINEEKSDTIVFDNDDN